MYLIDVTYMRIYDDNMASVDRFADQVSFVPVASEDYPGYYQFRSEKRSDYYIVNWRDVHLRMGRNDETDEFYRSSLFKYSPEKMMFSPLNLEDSCYGVTRVYHNTAFGRPERISCRPFTVHVPGLSHTPGTISLQSVTDPNYYVQQYIHGYLRLGRITRNKEEQTSFFVNASQHSGYFFLSPEDNPDMVYGRDRVEDDGRLRVFRPFGNEESILSSIFGFEIPAEDTLGIPIGLPDVEVSDTGFMFTIADSRRRYILEPVYHHHATAANKYCSDQYNMVLANIPSRDALSALNDELASIQEENFGITLDEIATGLRSGVKLDTDVAFSDLNPAGWNCAVLVPSGGSFKLVGKKCDGNRSVLCSDP